MVEVCNGDAPQLPLCPACSIIGANDIPFMSFLKLRHDFIGKGMARLMQVKAGQLEIDVLKLPLYPHQILGTLFLAFTQRLYLRCFLICPFSISCV